MHVLVEIQISQMEGLTYPNKNKDYHKDVNPEKFEKWFADILFRLKDNCAFVMGNAHYSRKSRKKPTK